MLGPANMRSPGGQIPVERLVELVRNSPELQQKLRGSSAGPGPPGPPASGGKSSRLLRASKDLNRAAAAARIPARLLADVFVEDPETKKQIRILMDALQGATGAPLLAERARAGVGAARQQDRMPGKLKAFGKEVGSEVAMQAVPNIVDMLLDQLI